MVTNKVQSENIQLTTVSGTTHGDGCKINEQMEQKGTHNTVVGSSDEEFEKLLEEVSPITLHIIGMLRKTLDAIAQISPNKILCLLSSQSYSVFS